MGVKKSKESHYQVDGTLQDIKEKCNDALIAGGFKKINRSDLLYSFSACYRQLTVVGTITINLKENNNRVEINIQSTANTDNIFALFISPNDKIMAAFKKNFV